MLGIVLGAIVVIMLTIGTLVAGKKRNPKKIGHLFTLDDIFLMERIYKKYPPTVPQRPWIRFENDYSFLDVAIPSEQINKWVILSETLKDYQVIHKETKNHCNTPMTKQISEGYKQLLILSGLYSGEALIVRKITQKDPVLEEIDELLAGQTISENSRNRLKELQSSIEQKLASNTVEKETEKEEEAIERFVLAGKKYHGLE